MRVIIGDTLRIFNIFLLAGILVMSTLTLRTYAKQMRVHDGSAAQKRVRHVVKVSAAHILALAFLVTETTARFSQVVQVRTVVVLVSTALTFSALADLFSFQRNEIE